MTLEEYRVFARSILQEAGVNPSHLRDAQIAKAVEKLVVLRVDTLLLARRVIENCAEELPEDEDLLKGYHWGHGDCLVELTKLTEELRLKKR